MKVKKKKFMNMISHKVTEVAEVASVSSASLWLKQAESIQKFVLIREIRVKIRKPLSLFTRHFNISFYA
jgi:hypothetical protein